MRKRNLGVTTRFEPDTKAIESTARSTRNKTGTGPYLTGMSTHMNEIMESLDANITAADKYNRHCHHRTRLLSRSPARITGMMSTIASKTIMSQRKSHVPTSRLPNLEDFERNLSVHAVNELNKMQKQSLSVIARVRDRKVAGKLVQKSRYDF